MQYPKAPIVEAVLELRVATTLDAQLIAKIAAKFAQEYPSSEDQVNFAIEVNPTMGDVRQVQGWGGKKLSSKDQVDVVGIRSNAFACMRLAPYNGWEPLCRRAQSGWRQFKQFLERVQVVRIGIRNINRIDIPFGAEPIDIDHYLTIGPRLPELKWGPISEYTIQVVRPWPVDNCLVTITTGLVPSPLVAHASILLDIDVGANNLSLMRDDEIWEFVGRMHDYKNAVFEGCITDKSRELFLR